MFADVLNCNTGPREKVVVAYGLDPGGRGWTEAGSVEESKVVTETGDGPVVGGSGIELSWGLERSRGDGPKARRNAGSFQDDAILVFDCGGLLVEVGGASVVAQLAKGQEGAGFELGENMGSPGGFG